MADPLIRSGSPALDAAIAVRASPLQRYTWGVLLDYAREEVRAGAEWHDVSASWLMAEIGLGDPDEFRELFDSMLAIPVEGEWLTMKEGECAGAPLLTYYEQRGDRLTWAYSRLIRAHISEL